MSAIYLLAARRHSSDRLVTAWLVRRDGATDAAILCGRVLPNRVEEIAAATGLTVEWEDDPLPFETLDRSSERG